MEKSKQNGNGAQHEVMTVKEVAEYLRIHPLTVYKIEDLPCFRLGGQWRFRRGDIEKWIAKQSRAVR